MFISWALNIIMQAASTATWMQLASWCGEENRVPQHPINYAIAELRFYQLGPETEPELLHLLSI
ncbi:hypothetical protein D4U46_17045 [Escherichia coli]|nr:hypothetical protein [Escherichia coli]